MQGSLGLSSYRRYHLTVLEVSSLDSTLPPARGCAWGLAAAGLFGRINTLLLQPPRYCRELPHLIPITIPPGRRKGLDLVSLCNTLDVSPGAALSGKVLLDVVRRALVPGGRSCFRIWRRGPCSPPHFTWSTAPRHPIRGGKFAAP